MEMDPARIRPPLLGTPHYCNYSESVGALLQTPRSPLTLVYSPAPPILSPPHPQSQVPVERLLLQAVQLLDRPLHAEKPRPWQGPPLRSGLSHKQRSGRRYKVQRCCNLLALTARLARQAMPHPVTMRASRHRQQPTRAPCPAWLHATRRTLPR